MPDSIPGIDPGRNVQDGGEPRMVNRNAGVRAVVVRGLLISSHLISSHLISSHR
jgi:hypothetical protein